jgi:hypothetical protein
MMTPNGQALAISLFLLGAFAWLTLVIGFSLVALMRKMIGWVSG